MKVRNNYNYGKKDIYHSDPEVQDDRSVVEIHGNLTSKQEVERLFLAGAKNAIARMEQFDFGPEDDIPDDFVDVTREPDFDLADYQRYMNYLHMKYQDEPPKRGEDFVPDADEPKIKDVVPDADEPKIKNDNEPEPKVKE